MKNKTSKKEELKEQYRKLVSTYNSLSPAKQKSETGKKLLTQIAKVSQLMKRT